MAVLQMQRISICALKKNRKQILETLQRRGVVEITDISPQDSVFTKADTSQAKAQFEKNAAIASQALEVLDIYEPLKTSMLDMFAGQAPLSVQDYEAFSNERDEIMRIANLLVSLNKKVAENKAEILKLQAQLDALTPWLGLDLSLRFTGTRATAAFIGSLPDEQTLEAVYTQLAEHAPEISAVHVDLISQSKEQACIMVVCPRADTPAVEEALRAMGFVRPASPAKEPPAERKTMLEQSQAEAEKVIAAAEKEIRGLAGMRDSLRFMVDYFGTRSEKYDAIGRLAQSRCTFLLSGYIPQRDCAVLEAELSGKFDISIEFETPSEEDDTPTLLKNNYMAQTVEGIVESYSLPGKGEIDPTPIMAIFYYFLFGLMLSDFAYGAMLAIATGVLLVKFKNMDAGLRNTMRMFCYCGISTAVWGIVFSSYFGDVVTVVSKTFFGHEVIIPPLWFTPLDDPMRMLVFCMAVGVIHLFTGLGIQLYQHLKAKRYMDALSKVVFWYMLVGGGILFGLSTEMVVSILQLKFMLSAQTGSVFGWIAVIGAIGIVLTNGDSRNPLVRFAQGVYELYNVTGYLGDVLSYSRLLALGLATGVIGSVINQMGSMAGGGVIGAILFIVVFLFGHSLNLGINLLGAYVHCNRLQYVEFFGKFYEGGGRKFQPFAPHTKYYKFKEDIHNG